MGSDEEDVAQARLLELLAERQESVPATRRAELEAEIAAAAAVLGLEMSEVESLPAAVVEAERKPSSLEGRFRVMRRGRDIFPFVFGLALAPIFAGLGAGRAGAATLVVVAVGWVVRSRRRAAVFEIEPTGRVRFRRHGVVDWPEVDEVSFRYRYPWLAVPGRLERAAGETAVVRIHRRSRRPLRLAQGQLFQVKPKRQPIGCARLSRFLREQATAAGMKAKSDPGRKGAWRASRSTDSLSRRT